MVDEDVVNQTVLVGVNADLLDEPLVDQVLRDHTQSSLRITLTECLVQSLAEEHYLLWDQLALGPRVDWLLKRVAASTRT